MILILGGARSGKSKLAIDLAKKQCGRVAYIATGPACDEEMKLRIKLHRKSRPKNWLSIEAQEDLPTRIKKIPKSCDGVIIECIATYISNLMLAGLTDPEILNEIKKTLKGLDKLNKNVFIVSNEVGSGVVPDSELGRRFRDIVGNVNQVIAKHADEVYMVVAGLPVKFK